MFCRKCGKEIPDDSDFCPGCGEKTVPQKEDSNNTGQSDTSNIPGYFKKEQSQQQSILTRPLFQKKNKNNNKTKTTVAIVLGCFAILIIIIVVLVANNNRTSSAPPIQAPTELPVQTEEPTPTPTASPTPTPEPTPTPKPTKTPKPTPKPKPWELRPVVKVNCPSELYLEGTYGRVGVRLSKVKAKVEETSVGYKVRIIAGEMVGIEKSTDLPFAFKYKMTDSDGYVLASDERAGFIEVDVGDRYRKTDLVSLNFLYDDLPNGKYTITLSSTTT